MTYNQFDTEVRDRLSPEADSYLAGACESLMNEFRDYAVLNGADAAIAFIEEWVADSIAE